MDTGESANFVEHLVPLTERTPLVNRGNSDYDDDVYGLEIDRSDGSETEDEREFNLRRSQWKQADHLSERLLAIDDDDVMMEDLILRESLKIGIDTPLITMSERELIDRTKSEVDDVTIVTTMTDSGIKGKIFSMTSICVLAFGLITAALWVSVQFIGPPNQPVGPYQLIEQQEGDGFFEHYTFYKGADSVGSNGYVDYVSLERAREISIVNISHEVDEINDIYQRNILNEANSKLNETGIRASQPMTKPFLYLQTAATDAGPRESTRLEGKRRFNRGLFIIDVRHLPVSCGAWPAFWLTDEANWPINGEIDIVEGVNFQSEAKTALHTTKGCDMFDTPIGTMSGVWDTAVGIPDRKTGIPDMTSREAKNCFVYDPHQWLNQGCVTIDNNGGSMGAPLNEKGGGVFALEWDPAYRHIRTWVFSPHSTVPENLMKAIETASEQSESDRVMPNPEEWPLPYGYFPIGDQTNCEGTKFRNMRLVLNTALCGSVSGNRFFVDCKNESQTFKSCEEYIKSRPAALSEAYWKIRGVYVYQREWEKAWLGH